MHFLLPSVSFVTLLCASAFASPLDKRNGEDSKIYRQPVTTSTRNGTRALYKAYRKYQWTPDANTSSTQTNEKIATAGGSGSGDVTATPEEHNSEFLCPVSIGGQIVNLNVDTGSSDLWVFNTALPASDTKDHAVYDSSKSKTYSPIGGATFSMNYGDGSQTYGKVGVDTVAVGGISVMGQAVELPTAISSSFTKDVNSDGLLGLGFKSANGILPEAQPTFFENAMSSLKEPIFTANLKANTAGNYHFGVIDHTAYTGSISYTPVNNSAGFWQFQTKPGSSPGIADTGSSLLLLDTDIVDAYWAPVKGHSSDSQGIIFPCDAVLPDFKIELGGSYTATVPGGLINYAPATNNPGFCFGGIQSNLGQGLNIFGDIMFESQFVVFDAGNMQIGFAPHAA